MSEPQPELVCGSGPDAFVIHDTGVVDQRVTRWYNADGDLTKRVIHERWRPAFWSNPLTGNTVPYTQNDKITTVLAVPGDFDSATETTVGENIYTDPVTHKKVLASTGRVVFGADGSLDFRAGSSRSSTRSSTGTCRCSTRSARRSRSAPASRGAMDGHEGGHRTVDAPRAVLRLLGQPGAAGVLAQDRVGVVP